MGAIYTDPRVVGTIYAEPGVVGIAGGVDTAAEEPAAEEPATPEELETTDDDDDDDDPCAGFPPGAKQFPPVGPLNGSPATVVTVMRSAGPGFGYSIAVPAMLRHSPSAI